MTEQTLATRFKERLDATGVSVDALAERTKIPRSTVRTLAGEACNAIVPPRVYLQGHALLLARELEIPKDEATALFEASYPVVDDSPEAFRLDTPRLPKVTMAVAAGLGSIALLAIVLAFVS